MGFDTSLLRWVVLAVLAPLWWPFVRLLWQDFNSTLAEEGGLFGRKPGIREREAITAEKATRPDPLVSEPWARAHERGQRKLRRNSETRALPGATREARGFGRRARRGRFR